MKHLKSLFAIVIASITMNVVAQKEHYSPVNTIGAYWLYNGAIVLDGEKDDFFVWEPTTMDSLHIVLTDDENWDPMIEHAGKFWIAYDDAAIYGFAEITGPDFHGDDEFALCYDFGDPSLSTQYGWEGEPVNDNTGAYERQFVNTLGAETANRGTKWFIKRTPSGYNVEWETPIYPSGTGADALGVTQFTDTIADMLDRGVFMFDCQFTVAEYDPADSSFIKRAYIAWHSNDNNLWQSSQMTGIVSLSPIAGISNVTAQPLEVYPNPASDKLYIKKEVATALVEVYTIAGAQVIPEGKLENCLDISTLSNGMYLVKVTDLEGAVYIARFVKK